MKRAAKIVFIIAFAIAWLVLVNGIPYARSALDRIDDIRSITSGEAVVTVTVNYKSVDGGEESLYFYVPTQLTADIGVSSFYVRGKNVDEVKKNGLYEVINEEGGQITVTVVEYDYYCNILALSYNGVEYLDEATGTANEISTIKKELQSEVISAVAMGILFVIHITLGIVFLVIFLTSRAKSETKTKTEEKRENPPVTNAEIVVAPFEKLSAKQFHDICSLRNEVFVVEQNCVYQDLDGFDEGAMHVCLYENGVLAAYCRVLDKNTKHAEVSIGRVVSRTRKKGHGAMVMKRAIEVARTVFDAAKIEVSAQCYAIPFYARFGFVACSEVYLEDGIEHKLLRLDF